MIAMRRQLAGLALVAALVAAGCSDGGSDPDPGEDAAACPVEVLDDVTSPVEITFWHTMSANNATTLQKLVDDYNGGQDKVRVELVFQGTYDEAAEKYLTGLRGGTLPNLVMLEDSRAQAMIDSKSMAPVQACVDADDYSLEDVLPAALSQYTIDDTLWPMPFNVSGPVLFYNTLAFEKAGLDVDDPPSTYDELLVAARAIKDSGAAKSGIALTTRPWYLEQIYAKAGKDLVDNDDGRTGRATASQLEDEVGIDALDFMRTAMKDELAVNVGSNVNESDNLFALGAGTAAMTVGTSAAIGTIYAVKDGGQFPNVGVGVAPMPGPSSSDGGVLAAGSSLWMVGKDKSDLERVATWDFLKFLDRPSSQVIWHIGSGYLPLRGEATEDPAIVDLWKRRPAYRVAYDQLLASKGGDGAMIGPYAAFRDALEKVLEQVLLEDVEPAAALKEADEAATEALESYNDRVED
jgi:sn-glycerol 3-phosphate transport system substrate-binding protein